MASLLDNAAPYGLLSDSPDPRIAVLQQILDPAVTKRAALLPMVRTMRPTGSTMVPEAITSREFGTPQIAVDMLGSALLPGAAAQGYTPTMQDAAQFSLDTMLGGLLGSAPRNSLAANALRQQQYDDAIKLGATRSGMSEDAFAGLARQEYVNPQVARLSVGGKELGFDTPYSKSLMVPVERLQDLDAGLLTTAPATAGPRNLKTTIENMEGKVLVPMPGDRTSRDVISQMAGQNIDPYHVQGGYAYMPDVQGWASGQGVISRYKSMFDELEGKGVAVGTPMSGTGSDFARAGVDLLYQTHDVYGMPAATKKAIIADANKGGEAVYKVAVKKAKEKAKEKGEEYVPPKKIAKFKAFDGSEKKLLDASPMHRKLLMETLDKAGIAKMEGAPNAVTLRHAITDDRFRDLKRGNPDPLSGFDFMSFANPKVMPTSQTPLPHDSYSHHLSGNYLGGLETPIPRSVLFPDFAKRMADEGRGLSRHNYLFDLIKPKQLVTPKVIEGVQKFTRGLFD